MAPAALFTLLADHPHYFVPRSPEQLNHALEAGAVENSRLRQSLIDVLFQSLESCALRAR
jgi:type III secretory pathway component EscT